MDELEKTFITLNPTIAWEENSDFSYFAIHRVFLFRYFPVKGELVIEHGPNKSITIRVQDQKLFSESVRHGVLNERNHIFAVVFSLPWHEQLQERLKVLIQERIPEVKDP